MVEYNLLLISGGNLQEIVVKVVVIFAGKESVVVHESADNCDVRTLGRGFDTQDCVLWPICVFALGSALACVAGGQVVGYRVLHKLGVVDIDGSKAGFLRYKGMLGLRLEKETGEKVSLAGCGAQIAREIDHGDELGVVIVKAEKVVKVGVNAIRERCGVPR